MQNDIDINELIHSFSKFANVKNELSKWEKLLDEAQKPSPKNSVDKAASLVKKGVLELASSAKKLKGITVEDAANALNISKYILASNNNSIESIEKFSRDFNSLSKTAQLQWASQFGSKAMKSIPYIGVIISTAMAIKNLYYGFAEYRTLSQISEDIGLSWYETLFESSISQKLVELKDDPDGLLILSEVSKSARIFVDEAVSFGANYVDAIKDLVFLVIEAAVMAGSTIIPAGWGALLGVGAVDMGLSIIIGIFEYYAEESLKSKYSEALEMITSIASFNIERIQQDIRKSEYLKEDKNYQDMTFEERLKLIQSW